MLEAGKMNRRVRVQAKSGTRDAAGEPLEEWQDVMRCWAQVQAITSNTLRRYSAAGFTSQVSHIVTVRWRAGNPFQAGQRVQMQDGRTYQVEWAVDPTEAHEQFDLYCLDLSVEAAP